MFVYEIVHKVHEKYRGICTRLAERTRKSKVWWSSHGLEPRSLNPDSGGNPSAVDDFFDYCELYEAVTPGAGLSLSEWVAAELRSRFTAIEDEPSRRILRQGLSKEAFEALEALDECEFSDASIPQLKAILGEVQDLNNKAAQTVGHLLAVLRKAEFARASERTIKKFGRAA
jgi:hypothetical protein